mmetsp:Transcript_75241/g.135541  ORF Transcript_75241/g.135541 Transcript_75241/m.135541 type:complete len:220 (-) Transcript_75241:622-1281(-)
MRAAAGGELRHAMQGEPSDHDVLCDLSRCHPKAGRGLPLRAPLRGGGRHRQRFLHGDAGGDQGRARGEVPVLDPSDRRLGGQKKARRPHACLHEQQSPGKGPGRKVVGRKGSKHGSSARRPDADRAGGQPRQVPRGANRRDGGHRFGLARAGHQRGLARGELRPALRDLGLRAAHRAHRAHRPPGHGHYVPGRGRRGEVPRPARDAEGAAWHHGERAQL